MQSSAVPPSRFFGYFQVIWGRHSVVPHRNRSLRLGMAGRGSGDTIIRLGWHVPRLRQREKPTRPSPMLVYLCNDAVSRIQEGPRLRCTQARSLSARDGQESSRPASASEVDLDARLCADRRQSCNANRQLIGSHRSAVKGCPRTLRRPEGVARSAKVLALCVDGRASAPRKQFRPPLHALRPPPHPAPPTSIIAILQVNSASDWLVPHCGDSIRGTLTLTVFLPCGEVF